MTIFHSTIPFVYDTTTLMTATVLMVSVGFAGLLSNFLAMFVIYRNPLLHNTFGLLCFSHLVSNVGMLFCFTTWPVAMILNQDNSLAHSVTGKRFGQCTIIFWWSCIIAHLAISINRYVSIVFPIKSYIWFTVPNTKYAIFCIWLIGFLVTIPYFWHDTCYVAFNAHTFQWTYAEDPCGQFLSLFDFIGGVILCSFAFTIDMLTLFRLREANNIIGISTQTAAEATKRRKTEIRFFTQAFTQCIVFCICLLSFHIFTLLSDSVWWQFSMVTMIWILAHSLDGLIVVLFHFRFSLCKNKLLTSTMMLNSSTNNRGEVTQAPTPAKF
ncbi:hypothetical protein L5515_010644 [Caenorhabditis briggsae]|uniref:G-protein coupled receptors family 1 profile domain-containing protein n=1 Tax=Caenorhabditis briggsae TaxID=6238 RepID=A0AAE9D3S2_CAEBR|nr:hypothetical protein L3Y34_003491 [Caenorhabditis briggsae]UMM27285.1 hypothetical protein L5515_010644 [Caenorhabditis briggsae]